MKNQKSIQLINDFTNEYLSGDINNLATFDIKQVLKDKVF